MRLFIGVFLPEDIKNYLYEVQDVLRKNIDGKIKWEAKSRIHLTLKFLGEVDEDKLNIIKERLNKIKFKKFKVNLDKIGVFPNYDYIKVIWVGLNPMDKAIELSKKIDSELLDLFHNDQEFKIHITLARVKLIKNKFNNLNIKIDEKKFEINEFYLIKSELSKDGAKYYILERFKLI